MKTAILLVAYGTSSPQGRGSLRQFDTWVRERFPGICVRWALSSELLRTRLTRARQKNDSVLKALQRLRLENFTHVAVQPLQIIPGSEHTDVRADADEAGRLDGLHVSIGMPLLACDEDIRAAARAVLAHLPRERRADEDVVLMGHGSRRQAVTAYAALAGAVRALDARVHVGTMSGALELEALLPRQTSIIDVALLAGLGTGSTEDRLTLLGTEGRKAALPRAVVTALTAEITIFMREQPDDFFSYTDLLDFPGYRSRLKILDLDKELEREGALQNLFLRGKVAYLFERYCEEHELTSMLLCIGPGNQEVQDLPRAVYDWICSTHGEDPAHRAGKAPSLFFVLTKMDMEFEKKAGSPSVEQRWNTRLQSSLLDFFGKQHDWPTNWDGAHPFRNIFLLRNPNFRCEAIFTFDAQGNESGIRPDQTAYVEEVRRAFVDSPLVRRHVDDPEAVWQAQ